MAADHSSGEHIQDGNDRIPDKTNDEADAEKRLQTTAEASASSESGPSYPGYFKQVILIAALMLAMFIVSLDGSIIATAIPTITAQFHSSDDVGWYGSAFFIGLAMFQGFWGKAYRIFGQKSVFLTCIAIFEIGSLVVATAPNSPAVIAGRAVQGLGGAGVTSGAYLIVAFVVQPKRLSVVMGLFGVVWAVSSIVGPLLGGVLTQVLSWRWCFYINLPIGGAAFAVVLLFFQTPAHAKFGKPPPWTQWPREFDIIGILLGLGAWTCLLLALQEGGTEKAWSSSFIIGLIIGFGLLVIAFALAEWVQGDSAMLPMRLLKTRTIAVCAVYNFLASNGMLVRTYTLPTYFQAVQGTSPSTSGIRTLPSVLSTSIATFISASLLGNVGYYPPFLWVGGILNVVGSGIYYLLTPTSTTGQWIGYQIVVGVGAGTVIQIPVMVAQKISQARDMSMTVGIMMFTQFVGGGVGVSSGEAILNNRLINTLPANISAPAVLDAGATGLRQAFPSSQDLAIVVASYMTGLRAAWIFSTAMIGASLITLLFAECVSIKNGPADQQRSEEKASGASDAT